MEPYSIPRDTLAQMIAAHISGIADANPDNGDYDLADRFIRDIENSLI